MRQVWADVAVDLFDEHGVRRASSDSLNSTLGTEIVEVPSEDARTFQLHVVVHRTVTCAPVCGERAATCFCDERGARGFAFWSLIACILAGEWRRTCS